MTEDGGKWTLAIYAYRRPTDGWMRRSAVSDGPSDGLFTASFVAQQFNAARSFALVLTIIVAFGLGLILYAITAADCGEVGACDVAYSIASIVIGAALGSIAFGAAGWLAVGLLRIVSGGKLNGVLATAVSTALVLILLGAAFTPSPQMPAVRLAIFLGGLIR
jgi:hypothetical protein